MKNKLRKIVINNAKYYYKLNSIYKVKLQNDYECISYFKAYVYEDKNTPLIIKIKTMADYITGNPLNVGTNGINLNRPKWARELILLGIDRGWNGSKKVELEFSYYLLQQIKGV